MIKPTNGLIDYWCNGFTPDRRGEWDKGLSSSPINFSEQLATAFLPPEDFVAAMDRDGVRAVLVPAVVDRVHVGHSPFSDVEPDAGAVAEVAAAFPDRVYGLYSIDPGNATKGVRDLERCVRDHGFVGAQIHTHSWGRRLDDRDYYPYYAKCEELGVPIVMQVGHSASRAPSENGRPFTADRPAIYFAGLDFVLSHTGWPWVDEAIAMAWKHPNVYIGTATHQPRYWSSELKDFAGGRGCDKVLVGTGFPVLRHAQVLAQINDLGYPDVARHAIVHDNAARLFRLD
ncbi:MAG TPA: amidohydrolase family protein [Acidimicrobiales bacterium]|nr:amidohydrolase family protein [Acidimicrobiales bacterium]